MPIQILLVAALFAVGWTLFRGPGSAAQQALRKLLAIGVMLIGAALVIFPDILTRVANLVGVGRGTDLLLYGLVVAFGFATVACFQRMFHLERRLETLTRAVALSSVEIAPRHDAPR